MIVSGWSGQMDFLHPEHVSLVPGRLKDIHPSAVVENILIKESQWFEPDMVHASQKMQDVFSNYKKYEVGAKRQAHFAKENFSFDKMIEKLGNYYTNYVKESPKLVLPQLPKLNRL
jgi:hypothetical protein